MSRSITIALFAATAMLTTAVEASAEQSGVITGGAADVKVDGRPAARIGDTTSDGAIINGSSNVFINGRPAAVVGGRTNCGGTTVTGSNGVFINGRPMARQGDMTSSCPGK